MVEIKAYALAVDKKSYPTHKWDFGFVKEAFDIEKIEVVECETLPEIERAFVIIAGFENRMIANDVSRELNKINRVVLFVTGDETGAFDYAGINHPNIEIWVQSPFPQHAQYNKMPIGVTSDLKKYVPPYSAKKYDAFYSGQVNHQRREELVMAMNNVPNVLCNATPGFTQGYPIGEYYHKMHESKIAPSPAGAITIDSFRFYEAIEMLSLPIADSKNSVGYIPGFWELLFGENVPFNKVTDWNDLSKLVPDLLNNYPENLHRVVSWWIKYKRDFRNKIMEQVNA